MELVESSPSIERPTSSTEPERSGESPNVSFERNETEQKADEPEPVIRGARVGGSGSARAFLKRGSRMPVSKLPQDGSQEPVLPIVNPVAKPRPKTEGSGGDKSRGTRSFSGDTHHMHVDDDAADRSGILTFSPPRETKKRQIQPPVPRRPVSKLGMRTEHGQVSSYASSRPGTTSIASAGRGPLLKSSREGSDRDDDELLDRMRTRADTEARANSEARANNEARTNSEIQAGSQGRGFDEFVIRSSLNDSVLDSEGDKSRIDRPESLPGSSVENPTPTGAAPVSGLVQKYFYESQAQAGRRVKPPTRPRSGVADAMQAEPSGVSDYASFSDEVVAGKMKELEVEVERFRRENDVLRKLKLDRQTALDEADRLKEKAKKDWEAAKRELEAQRLEMQTDKKRMASERDRQKSVAQQLKESSAVIASLKSKLASAESELIERIRKHKMDNDRLTAQVEQGKRRIAELENELRAASRYAGERVMASGPGLMPGPVTGVRPGTSSGTSVSQMQAGSYGVQANSYGVQSGLFDLGLGKDAAQQGFLASVPVLASSGIDGQAGLVSNPTSGAATLGAAAVGASPLDASSSGSGVRSEVVHTDGRRDRTYKDGRREALFPSGLKKTVWPDGRAVVDFPNGDTKETASDGVVKYYYASTGATQTTYADGNELLVFASGQVEKHFKDGGKDIQFPNGVRKIIHADGREEVTVARPE